MRKDISCIFHILKSFLQRIFFFNVHARIACNAKAFRNVVLNQSFNFFSLQPFKTLFHSSFLFLEQNIASSACTMEKCLSRLWIANLKEVFFNELITINNQIEFIRMGLKHVFYFYPLYHWAHKKCAFQYISRPLRYTLNVIVNCYHQFYKLQVLFFFVWR